MKILIVTNIPTPYRIVFFNVLHQQMLLHNGQLMVLYCSKKEPDRHWEINPNEQKFSYKILKGFHINTGRLFFHFNPSILKETKKFNPDYILYAGSWNMPTVIFSLIYNSIFKKKYKKLFWSEGHEGSIIHKVGIVSKVRKYIQNKFDGFAVPNKRSELYLFDYLKINKKPIVILPNTVDGAFYSKNESWSIEKTNATKERFGIPINSKLLIQVAQIEKRKGTPELIDYWSQFSKEVKEDYHLVLVGEGSLRNQLMEKCTENKIERVHFVGNQSKESVRQLLFSSDIFLLLTKNDPNPLTLIEASYAKLPILTTKFAGNCEEIIVDNKNGYILEKISFQLFEKLFIKTKYLVVNEEAGNISYQNVIDNFDIEIVAETFIQQLIKKI